MSDQPLRILIVAADALTRAGLAAILGTQVDLKAVGQLDPADDLNSALDVFEPDVLLWDIGYGADEALVLLGDFILQNSEDAVPLLALIADSSIAPSVWQTGARALLPRSAPVSTLAAALHAAAARLVVLDPLASAALLVPVSSLSNTVEALTVREREVLQLVANGLPNKSIARELAISEHTVKFHVNAILNKFGAQSRTEAVVIASRAGLVLL
jgi:two-component system nitrate/nitrite response regulator NarL